MSRPVILCVDDERIILSSLKAQLQNNLPTNYQIEVAESAEEALEIIEDLINENITIPLIIADQIMPGMKGDELLGKVKRLLPQTLTIMLTGQASADAVGHAVNKAGLFRYLSKPWDEDDLILTIQSALDSYVHQKELIKQSHYQTVINKTLSLALNSLSLDEQLCRALNFLVEVPCLSPPSHAAIYFKHHAGNLFDPVDNREKTSTSASQSQHIVHFKKLCEVPKNQTQQDLHLSNEELAEYLSPQLRQDEANNKPYFCYPIIHEQELTGLIFIYTSKDFVLTPEISSFLSSFSQAISGMYNLTASNQALRHSNIQLEHHKEKLEQLVLERTEALNVALAKQAEHNAMLQTANKELAYFATTDFLTGLLNRRRFFELAEEHYLSTQKEQSPCTVAMVDIDHFKQINDTYGHQAGDELLKKIANTLLQNVEKPNLVSRFGGEEFALLFPNHDIERTLAVCQRVLKQIESTELHTLSETISATVSMGLASCHLQDNSLEKALMFADKALYEAKNNGRNSISIYKKASH